jgi:hypothetical protein
VGGSYYHHYQPAIAQPRMPCGGLGMTGNDVYTTVLLHMDGADASTTVTDSNAGGSAHTWTARGNAQIDTAQSKFGGASLLLDGTGDYIDTPDHADWTFGSGDFTVDLWFSRNGGNGAECMLFGDCTSGFSYPIYLALNVNNRLAVALNDGAATMQGTTQITTSGWHHVALVRTGNTMKLFVDGTQEGGDVAFASSINSIATKLSVGRLGEADYGYFTGWIDEFRISKGIARWTAGFTPPTSAYGP